MEQTKKNRESISWVIVNSMGKLKISKSSYYYLVIVPILVKTLEKINNPFFIEIGGSEMQLYFELPFSWYLFYFGAVCIAFGSILYQVFCPELIRKYRNYGEFLEAGESDAYLDSIDRKYDLNLSWTSLWEKPYIEEIKKEIIKIEPRRIYDEPTYEERDKIIDYKYNIKYQEERKNYFNKLYARIKYCRIETIYSSFILYILGFSAFGWVIVQNIIFVLKHLF